MSVQFPLSELPLITWNINTSPGFNSTFLNLLRILSVLVCTLSQFLPSLSLVDSFSTITQPSRFPSFLNSIAIVERVFPEKCGRL